MLCAPLTQVLSAGSCVGLVLPILSVMLRAQDLEGYDFYFPGNMGMSSDWHSSTAQDLRYLHRGLWVSVAPGLNMNQGMCFRVSVAPGSSSKQGACLDVGQIFVKMY